MPGKVPDFSAIIALLHWYFILVNSSHFMPIIILMSIGHRPSSKDHMTEDSSTLLSIKSSSLHQYVTLANGYAATVVGSSGTSPIFSLPLVIHFVFSYISFN